jgi:hypothetical protein
MCYYHLSPPQIFSLLLFAIYSFEGYTFKYVTLQDIISIFLQAWSGPEGSRKLRFLDYMTTAQDGGKVVSLMHRPLLPPGNAPGTHFC